MRSVLFVFLAGFLIAALGCGSGSEQKSTKELNDAQAATQKQADDDERQHAKESKEGKKK
jgi:hypothetical protein